MDRLGFLVLLLVATLADTTSDKNYFDRAARAKKDAIESGDSDTTEIAGPGVLTKSVNLRRPTHRVGNGGYLTGPASERTWTSTGSDCPCASRPLFSLTSSADQRPLLPQSFSSLYQAPRPLYNPYPQGQFLQPTGSPSFFQAHSQLRATAPVSPLLAPQILPNQQWPSNYQDFSSGYSYDTPNIPFNT